MNIPFSKRFKHVAMEKELQLDSLFSETKNKLWNIFYKEIKTADDSINTFVVVSEKSKNFRKFSEKVSIEIMNIPVDETKYFNYLGGRSFSILPRGLDFFKSNFLNEFEFHQCLDTVEYFVKIIGLHLVDEFNKVLTEMNVGYRLDSNGSFISITSKVELSEVNQAQETSDHIINAARMLFDRENPDYLNSIKESIIAIESVCKNKFSKDTLAGCLDHAKSKINLNKNFVESIKEMYKFASDERGIRHAGSTESEITFHEAKLVLIYCSGVVNYLNSIDFNSGEIAK